MRPVFQLSIDEVNLRYKEERAALEKKYEEARAPVLEKRMNIVSGELDVELEGDSGKCRNCICNLVCSIILFM